MHDETLTQKMVQVDEMKSSGSADATGVDAEIAKVLPLSSSVAANVWIDWQSGVQMSHVRRLRFCATTQAYLRDQNTRCDRQSRYQVTRQSL